MGGRARTDKRALQSPEQNDPFAPALSAWLTRLAWASAWRLCWRVTPTTTGGQEWWESESALLASKTSLVRELQLVLLQLVVLDGRQPTIRSWHASGEPSPHPPAGGETGSAHLTILASARQAEVVLYAPPRLAAARTGRFGHGPAAARDLGRSELTRIAGAN